MMRGIRFFLGVLVLLLTSACNTPAAAASSSTIRVHVTVQTDTGTPVADVLVALLIGQERVRDAKTDDAGKALLESALPSGASDVEIRHGFARPSSFADDQQLELSQRQEQIKTKYHLIPRHSIDLKADQQDYNLVITAWPAADVRMIIVDDQGQERDGRLYGPAHSYFGWVQKGRVNPLHGIPRGRPSLLVATSEVSSPALMLKTIRLDPDNKDASIDLGEIVIPPLPKGIPINAAIVGDREIRKTGLYAYSSGLTFISIDGSLMVSYEGLDGRRGPPKSDGPVPLEARGGQPTLPLGRYFVVPGWIMTGYTDDHAAVLSALLDGADLKQSKIPQIEVKDGGENTFTINVLEAHQAIQAACAKSGEPTSKAVMPDGASRSSSQ